VPGGRVEQTDRTLTLRTLAECNPPPTSYNIVVANRDGYPIKISDVGHSEDASRDELTAGRLTTSRAAAASAPAIGHQHSGYCQRRQERLAELKKGLPAGYSLDVVRDQSIFHPRFIFTRSASI